MPLKNSHILLVEDDRVGQLLIANALEGAGCQVDIASSGEQALEHLRREQYHLVLMDCHMPGMDGFETTETIRSDISKTLPVIALTAHESKEIEEKCMEAGINAYMFKPIDKEKLFKLMANLLRK